MKMVIQRWTRTSQQKLKHRVKLDFPQAFEALIKKNCLLPYSCSFCKRGFATKTIRSRHIRRQHGKDKMFLCHLCNQSSLRADVIKRHYSNRHPGEPLPIPLCHQNYNPKLEASALPRSANRRPEVTLISSTNGKKGTPSIRLFAAPSTHPHPEPPTTQKIKEEAMILAVPLTGPSLISPCMDIEESTPTTNWEDVINSAWDSISVTSDSSTAKSTTHPPTHLDSSSLDSSLKAEDTLQIEQQAPFKTLMEDLYISSSEDEDASASQTDNDLDFRDWLILDEWPRTTRTPYYWSNPRRQPPQIAGSRRRYPSKKCAPKK